MNERNLQPVDQEPVPSSLDEIVAFVDTLREGVQAKLAQDGVSLVVVPGMVHSQSSDTETRRLTVTIYDPDAQHGPRPDLRLAKFTTRVMGGNGEISGPATSLVLTENRITGENKVSHLHVVGNLVNKRVTVGDPCDEEQLHLLALLLNNFDPIDD